LVNSQPLFFCILLLSEFAQYEVNPLYPPLMGELGVSPQFPGKRNPAPL